MPQLLVRGLDADILSRLKALAKRNGRSLEAQLRLILHDAVSPPESQPTPAHVPASVPKKADRPKPSTPEAPRQDSCAPVPPMPNEKELSEFRRLYYARFGVELGEAEALEKAIGVLVLTRFQHERDAYNYDRVDDGAGPELTSAG